MTPVRFALRDADSFRCVECGATVATVHRSFGDEVVELQGSAVRKTRAEKDGIPYYESRRVYGGHRSRHRADRITAERRQLASPWLDASPDHHPIESGVFDTECPNRECGRRLRVVRDSKDEYGKGALL